MCQAALRWIDGFTEYLQVVDILLMAGDRVGMARSRANKITILNLYTVD